MANTGFALDEYAVPKFGMLNGLAGGTMPKSHKESGGLFSNVAKHAEAVPGPDYYYKDLSQQSFAQKVKGGKFSSFKRLGEKMMIKGTGPSVGQYQTDCVLCSPRTKGGMMSKVDRKCGFVEAAIKRTGDLPAPGKYNANHMEGHTACPVFAKSAEKTESRVPPKKSNLGPGSYNPSYALTERTGPQWTGSKGKGAESFLDKVMNQKDTTPAPGHVGIPTSKVEDLQGSRMHAARLLQDRDVSQIAPPSIESPRLQG